MVHTLPAQLLSTCNDGMMVCVINWANTVTMGYFWVIMVLSFSVTLFMATTRLGNTRAFGFASFAGLLMAVWSAIMGLMDWAIASIFIIVGFIGIIMMIMSEN